MTMQKICLLGCLSLGILFSTGCGGSSTSEKKDVAPAAAKIMGKGAIKDNDPYWNPGLKISQQHDEAQTLALLMMILASPPSRDDFLTKPGDPSMFSSTDPLLQKLFNADARHKVYKLVREFMLKTGNADTYKAYGDDFRKKIFMPLSKYALQVKDGDDPYPGNICPTGATVCDGSDGLGLSCAIQ
jgi:hypothetical protein